MSTAGDAVSPRSFVQAILASSRRLAFPVAVYPGLQLIPGQVRAMVTDPEVQARTQLALQARYHSPFLLSAMDLSVEAESFGASVRWVDDEVPTVVGRLVRDPGEVRRLSVPSPGEGRTRVPLATVRHLARTAPASIVVGGCIGPFSLAARLTGVTEALELTVDAPALVHELLEKATGFLIAYAAAFQAAGANALLIAEPSAGLLSPRALAEFSTPYLRQLRDSLRPLPIDPILHNCGARPAHLPALLDTAFDCFHFGAPMDMPTALQRVPGNVVVCGNLDPAGVFCASAPDQVAAAATSLLQATEGHRNFVLSSGCDIPPDAPLASLDALYGALESWNTRR